MIKIKWKISVKTGYKEYDPPYIKANEIAEVVFEPRRPFVVDLFKNCEGLGRIIIMDCSFVVMLGKVVEWKPAYIDEQDFEHFAINWPLSHHYLPSLYQLTICEILCVTKTILPKDIRIFLVQTIILLQRTNLTERNKLFVRNSRIFPSRWKKNYEIF